MNAAPRKRKPQSAAYRRNDEFKRCFAEVERALKGRVKHAGDRAKARDLIRSYLHQNPYWEDQADHLGLCADVRNLMTHEQRLDGPDPVYVSPELLAGCRAVLEGLLRPEPVSARYSREVFTLEPRATIAQVVREAHERDYSQFPVLDGDRYRGLVTENRVTKWLGGRVRQDGRSPDLTAVTVHDLLTEQKGDEGSVLAWARADAPVDEVMALFCLPERAELEVVLITETGGQRSPLRGIITTWDAARFVPAGRAVSLPHKAP